MSHVSVQSSFKVSGDVVFRELDREAVVLNLASGTYFGLNEVGTRIWHLIEEHAALAQVLDTIRGEYDAPPERLEQDLIRLVGELVAKGLVVQSDDPSAAR